MHCCTVGISITSKNVSPCKTRLLTSKASPIPTYHRPRRCFSTFDRACRRSPRFVPCSCSRTTVEAARPASCGAMSEQRKLTTDWNVILSTDYYKVAHAQLFNPNLSYVYSYVESRATDPSLELVCAGGSFVAKALAEYELTRAHIDEAAAVFRLPDAKRDSGERFAAGFDRARWQHIVDAHAGKLPLRIDALVDGTRARPGLPLLVVSNTDAACFWLPGYIESWMLSVVWYMTTVATKSLMMRSAIEASLRAAHEDPRAAELMLVDFGVRGAPGGCMGGHQPSAAALGGLAHLMVGRASDNLPALHAALAWGFLDATGPIEQPSILATEHSVMCSFGRDEEKAFEHLLSTCADCPISIVIDSFDVFAAVELLCERFAARIMARRASAPVILRPDSGDPVAVLPAVLRRLAPHFEVRMTAGGLLLFAPQLRVIQGDGITVENLPRILAAVVAAGFSPANLVFGSGGGLLQAATRDTFRFAYKASAAVRSDGSVLLLAKDPVTDPRKRSKAGFFRVVRRDCGALEVLTRLDGPPDDDDTENLLVKHYDSGKLLHFDTLPMTRERLCIKP